MSDLFIDCSPGVSGDMLLGAFHDLGVPKYLIEKTLINIGLENLYTLNFKESQSCSIRGIKTEIKSFDQITKRNWLSIKESILKANLDSKLKKRIYDVFDSLALAEAKVHGIKPEDVHFHEIGAIDSLVDIIGVCTSIEYLKPKKVFCNQPVLGKGIVDTQHGKLSIPSPAVIELLRGKDIEVFSSINSIEGELVTPTGIALLLNFVDSFQTPYKFSIRKYGVGIGNLKLQCPNLVRVLEIGSSNKNILNKKISPRNEEISVQEAWIDDQTPEDVSNFVQKLRNEGAYDVSYQTINMKKDRVGYSIQVILPLNKKEYFRNLWFKYSNTIGLRERVQSRWILPRRRGECSTIFGKVKAKQTLNPDGSLRLKIENDEVLRLSLEHNKAIKDLREVLEKSSTNFIASEDWK